MKAGTALIYKTIDAPTGSQVLTTQLNSMKETDAFIDYFMFRPTGPNSIWVTIGKETWYWGGIAIRSDPDIWTGPTSPSYQTPLPKIKGIGSSEFSVWPQILNPGNVPCAKLPTS